MHTIKIILILIILTISAGLGFLYINNQKVNEDIVLPFQEITQDKSTEDVNLEPESLFKKEQEKFGEIINILLIGNDTSQNRQEKGQLGFNTDSMILVSINPITNKVLLTSVPRDLWINDNKINSLYILNGRKVLEDAFEKVTGQKVDASIMVNFDQFEWIVDSFGGVNTEIKTTFTDNQFPNDIDGGYDPITFTQGYEIMNGDRALDYSRSRKGNNGEGSDLMRAKRQHLILIGMLRSIKNKDSIFWPMDLDFFYNSIKEQNIFTSLELSDVYYLWDFYKDYEKYDIESFVIDNRYVYHPGLYPESEYRAWVFIAKEPGFTNLHKDIKDKLNKTFVEPILEEDINNVDVINGSSSYDTNIDIQEDVKGIQKDQIVEIL